MSGTREDRLAHDNGSLTAPGQSEEQRHMDFRAIKRLGVLEEATLTQFLAMVLHTDLLTTPFGATTAFFG
jgi:hypothetical protein